MQVDRAVAIKDSSNVALVEYDVQNRKMRVTFTNGSVYLYDKVKDTEFGNLISAESVGRYFQSQIKGKYTYTMEKA